MDYIIKVLILDDDEDLLDLLTGHLHEQGIKVIKSTYTTALFSLIDYNKPDVVVLDYITYRLSKHSINGGELCHQLKTNPCTKHLPVILLSAYDRVINSLGLYGCDEFIAKPFDIDYLTNTIVKLAKQSINTNIL